VSDAEEEDVIVISDDDDEENSGVAIPDHRCAFYHFIR
jgi:hypothetical protein